MDKLKATLLICDDEELLLEKIKLLLEDVVENILMAYNGEECLQVMERENVDCVFCDINMPKMDGIQVIRELRKQGNSLPFIFYTAHGNEELMKEALKYGAFDFINKPELEELETVVRKGIQMGLKLMKGKKEEWKGTCRQDDKDNEFLKTYKEMLLSSEKGWRKGDP